MKETQILLLGGDGFLGKGLQKELSIRCIKFKSLDITDADLSLSSGKQFLTKYLKENNFSHVVILASKLGINIFNSEPKDAADYNKVLYNNIIQSCFDTILNENKLLSITFYSTSECFGSLDSIDDVITDKSFYNFNLENLRYLYSYNKYQIENKLFAFQKAYPKLLTTVKIIRPFNVYGKNQKRGVVYEMIRSALDSNMILYRENTTRTVTDIDFASKKAVDVILSNKNCKVNITDDRNSLTMKSLAEIIDNVIYEKFYLKSRLYSCGTDNFVQYRHTSKVDNDIKASQKIMEPHIIELANQICKNNLVKCCKNLIV